MIYVFFLSIPVLSYLLLNKYFDFANDKSILDKPQENRSLHQIVTPTGCGIIIVLIGLIYSSFILFFFFDRNISLALTFSILLLCLVSFIDDLINLSIKIRFFIYFFSVFGLMLSYEGISLIYNFDLKFLIVFFISVWFLNLYNFMDNSDLTLYTNFTSFSISVILIAIFSGIYIDVHNFIIIICFLLSILPFFIFNKPTAKMFLGDSGSISLAFIALWTCMYFYKISNIYIIAIFSTFFIDTSYTLLKRFINRKNIFKAHKEHFNQIYIEKFGIKKFLKINMLTHLFLIIAIVGGQIYRMNIVLFIIIVLIINVLYFYLINVRNFKTL